MNARKVLFVLLVGLVVSGFFLALFGQTAQAAPSQEHTAAAMDALVAQYGSLDQITDPGDVSAYRYIAMARFYEKYNPSVSSIQFAMDAIVARYGSLDKITDPGDVMAYRWLALAKPYEH